MANPDHLTRLLGGVPAWNDWRAAGTLIEVDLRGADLRHANLSCAVLVGGDLTLAKITEAHVDGAVFTSAVVWGANFFGSDVLAAHGLAPRTGWIQDKAGVPRRESSAALDRRGRLWHTGLQRAGGA